MPAIESKVRTNSDEFQQQREEMLALVNEFRALEQRVRDLSSSKKKKFRKRDQLLPRERISALLDDGSPWLEISTLAGLAMHDDDGKDTVMGGGGIIGIGYVEGVRCMVNASDSAIKGGTIAPMGLKKSLRGQEIAMKNKLPCVNLIESGGANLNYQSEIFVDGGKSFYNQSRLSAMGLPQITVVHGSSTAGGAYIPGLSDYVIMVKEHAKVFLAGPPLLMAATGEVATDEELGGAQMHTTVSGVSEYMAENDADAIRIAREVIGNLGWNDDLAHKPARTFDEPLYSPDELCGVVPTDYRKPFDVREVIARIVDGSRFLAFKELYGEHTVCGHAHIEGYACGIIGNNGPIDADGAAKTAQFIQLCTQSNTPLIFLQNTTGYLVGKEMEQGGIVKHGAKMIQAVANTTVPKITLHIGASFGAGNYGMCGRSYDPNFIFAWPNNRIAVMGGEQAATVMEIVTRQKMARFGQEPDADFLKGMKDFIIDKINDESRALYATARLWDDGLIDPRDTRKVLAATLSICREGQRRGLHPNTFGVGRM
jgi:geranyl-CoA carboxylase beta subunit